MDLSARPAVSGSFHHVFRGILPKLDFRPVFFPYIPYELSENPQNSTGSHSLWKTSDKTPHFPQNYTHPSNISSPGSRKISGSPHALRNYKILWKYNWKTVNCEFNAKYAHIFVISEVFVRYTPVFPTPAIRFSTKNPQTGPENQKTKINSSIRIFSVFVRIRNKIKRKML